MSLPGFEEVFQAIHGYAPFPWQARLAKRVVENGWPARLDIPTGCGKTSVIDIALYALAADPSSAPRRCLLVVDRRVIVDQAAVHAKRIRDRLAAGAAPELARRLRALAGGEPMEEAFNVAVLRGGMPRDTDWARRPDQVVVGVSTVDQVGSRMLFRGYGVSDRMKPVHAGLLGNDVVLFLDEVHFSEPFAQTLRAISSRCRRGPLESRFAFVEMSATPGTTDVETFRMDESDRRHPVVARRLSASKPVTLSIANVKGEEGRRRAMLAKHCVESVLECLKGSSRVIGVVVNRVDTAREVWRQLRDVHVAKGSADVVLLTGRMRPLDRERILETTGSLERATAAEPRDERPDPRPLVVVATQCIEAGADLDFDALVTECASLDALRQRFGRLNRRGELQSAPATICMRSDQIDPKRPDPIYGQALPDTWKWLESVADGLDMGTTSLDESITSSDVNIESLLAPKPDAPVLLPAHLDFWSQTAPIPTPDPDVALWLHGVEPSTPEVQIVWRADIEEMDLESARDSDEDARATFVDIAQAILTACPPSAIEAMSVPLYAARSWLGRGRVAEIADVVGRAAVDDEPGERVEAESALAVRWGRDQTSLVEAHDLRPGDTIVVPVERGGVSAGTFDPSSTDAVVDLGDFVQLRARGRAALRTHPGALACWNLSNETLGTAPTRPDGDDVDEQELIQAWLNGLPESLDDGTEAPIWSALAGAWPTIVESVRAASGRRGGRVLLPNGHYVLLGRRPAVIGATTEDDMGSLTEESVPLRRHLDDVRSWVAKFAKSLGLDPRVAGDLQLAASLHDVGKADPRFQRLLNGGAPIASGAEPLAKSVVSPRDRVGFERAVSEAGVPRGYRHELVSVHMLESSPEWKRDAHDLDLVLHLVASHHGWARPFAPARDDPEAVVVEFEHGGTKLSGTTRHGLARIDSGVADRFWRLTERFGWWGLAWLEAILRLADHRASESAVGSSK